MIPQLLCIYEPISALVLLTGALGAYVSDSRSPNENGLQDKTMTDGPRESYTFAKLRRKTRKELAKEIDKHLASAETGSGVDKTWDILCALLLTQELKWRFRDKPIICFMVICTIVITALIGLLLYHTWYISGHR